MRLGEGGDLRQHRHGFLRKFAHRRFAGEHDAIGAVEDGVGHVGRLGARGQAAGDHRFEHLRGGDDRLAREVGLRDELLLRDGDLLDRHFHAEIAARDHDAVGRGEDLVEVLERVGALDLGDDERLLAQLSPPPRARPRCPPRVRRTTGSRRPRRAERELQAGAVVFGERADAEIDARQVEPLARTQLAADGDRALHVVARDALDDELHQAVVEEEPVARASPRAAAARSSSRRAAHCRRCPRWSA